MIRALALVAIASCARVEADPAPAKRFEEDMMVRFHMHENFGLLHTMEKLLVHGKLDEARSLADAMAQAPDEPGLSTWATQTARVRDRAAAIAKSKTVEQALHAEARLAEACARCHVDAGAQPEFTTPSRPPADQPTITARMARHLWASDRLWEGMLGGADEPWRTGLDVLAASPLPAAQLGEEGLAIGRRLQQLATEARKRAATFDLADRATSYGEILVTCASCHAKPRGP